MGAINRILHAVLTHLRNAFDFIAQQNKQTCPNDRKIMKIASLHIRRVK